MKTRKEMKQKQKFLKLQNNYENLQNEIKKLKYSPQPKRGVVKIQPFKFDLGKFFLGNSTNENEGNDN